MLFGVISLYGIVFGCVLTVAGLFSGLQIVIVGLTHITLGIAFAVAGFAIANQRPWGYALGGTLSFGITVVSFLAVFSAMRNDHTSVTVVWGLILVFFVLVTLATRRRYRSDFA